MSGSPAHVGSRIVRPQSSASNIMCVMDVFEVRDATMLPRLAALHLWLPRTVDERLSLPAAGVFVLGVRMYRLPQPVMIPDSPHFLWNLQIRVDLPTGLFDRRFATGAAG